MKIGKIYLTHDILNFSCDLEDGETLIIIHKKYKKPNIFNCKCLSLDEFKKSPYFYLKNIKNLIFVGNSKIINPSNRIDPVFEVIHNNTPNLNKIIIDDKLFIGEEWRIIFAFITVNARYLNYSYSFLAQTEWGKFISGIKEDNPFSIENVLKNSNGIIKCFSKKMFDSFSIKTIPTSDETKKEYSLLKEELFKKEKTINGIIKKLSDFSKSKCKERNIPAVNKFFETNTVDIIKTDLKIDDYLLSKLNHVYSYCNELYSKLYERR